nr:MAG TPA: hypothetical protein [Caudoviricetes sp.]
MKGIEWNGIEGMPLLRERRCNRPSYARAERMVCFLLLRVLRIARKDVYSQKRSVLTVGRIGFLG